MMTPPNPDGISWRQLLNVAPNSLEFTELAKTLLSSDKHRKFNVSRFTPKEAAQLIDVIDIGILQNDALPNNLKSVAFGILRRVSGRFKKLPQSYLIEEGLSTEGDISSTSGFTTLRMGRLNGSRVAIKTLRLDPDDDMDEIASIFCKEVLLWPRLHHPNILPIYGISMSALPFRIISPWMENGNILDYTRKHPEVNRMSFLVEVANGLRYLHRIEQKHGNIRGANVLISSEKPPRARLTDLGLNLTMFDYTHSMSREIIAPREQSYKPTSESDIYALGMLIYEVLTGRPPFYKRSGTMLTYEIIQESERPLRPQDSERLGITDSMWATIANCWDKGVSSRLQIESVITCLTKASRVWVADVPVFLLASEAGISQVMSLKGNEAQKFMDELCKTLASTGINSPSGKTYLTRLKELCDVSGIFPSSFMLSEELGDLGARPLKSSGSADIYKATYRGREVAVKALKIRHTQTPEYTHKRLIKEVILWAWLRHENIVPFIGISAQPTRFLIVSEWIPDGHITSFIARNSGQNPFPLLIDVAVGLQYLHRNGFVHGDVKGANILIDSDLRARLTGFNRARIIDDDAMKNQKKPSTGVERDPKIGEVGDSIRWSAPELMDPDRFGYTKNLVAKLPSKSTDLYALGMTILEVLTGHQPFGRTSDEGVVKKVIDGVRLERPNSGFGDGLWNLLQLSWSEEHESQESKRPSIGSIMEQLQKDSSSWFSARLPFPTTAPKRWPFRGYPVQHDNG